MSVRKEGIPLTLYSNLIALQNADIELYPSCYKRMLSKKQCKTSLSPGYRYREKGESIEFNYITERKTSLFLNLS